MAKLVAIGANVHTASSFKFDLRDQDKTDQLFSIYQPDVVFHLAATCGGIGANMAEPGRYIGDNLKMGVNIIESSRKWDVEKLILVGTVCSYPKHTPVPFTEDQLWNGYPEETNAPYGIAKKALLAMAQAYRAQYKLNSVYLIPANLYGPGDNFDYTKSHVIPALIRKFSEARDRGDGFVTVWGDGSATREFLYVEDCADALIAAAECYSGSEPVNIGTGHEISIRKLAYEIAGFCGFDGRIRWDASKPNGQPRRVLDTSRAEREMGWKAKVSLAEGLKRTVHWHRENWKAEAA
jgi:nucleoside-diphosphate-sugar epimerase